MITPLSTPETPGIDQTHRVQPGKKLRVTATHTTNGPVFAARGWRLSLAKPRVKVQLLFGVDQIEVFHICVNMKTSQVSNHTIQCN